MNEQESEQQFRVETTESRIKNQESGKETEASAMAGAEMLETPPDGSFVHGLQVFVAWVKALVASDK